jgi:hypothetical protein
MPVDYSRYPADWKAISLRIRERDHQCCKWCGVPNGAWIVRWQDKDGDGYTIYTHAEDMKDGSWQAWNEDEDGPCSEIDEFVPALGDGKPIKVVLTVAHYPDPDPSNCSDGNLQSLCQRCHNRTDAPMRARHAAETRRRKKMRDQLTFWDGLVVSVVSLN